MKGISIFVYIKLDIIYLVSTQQIQFYVYFYSERVLLPAEVCISNRSESLAKLSLFSPNTLVMATFFGEVLSVYSRAVEEDDEDLDENEEDEQIRRELEEKR